MRIEDSEGNLLNIYTDLDKLKRHLKEISPEDSKVIEDYLKASRSMVRADFFAMNMGGIGSKLKIIPRAYSLIKWTGTILEDYAGKNRSEFLKKAFPTSSITSKHQIFQCSLICSLWKVLKWEI